MRKSDKIDNILIKRKLIDELRKNGINRINRDSLISLNEYVLNDLRRVFKVLREELIIRGKKTLEKKDVEDVLDRINNKESSEI